MEERGVVVAVSTMPPLRPVVLSIYLSIAFYNKRTNALLYWCLR